MSDDDATISISIEGRQIAKGDEPSESIGVVLPGYFETMRIPILSGRGFREQDDPRGVAVMMINQAFARKYFPQENPLGKRILVGLGDGVVNHPMREVVGVVGDIKGKGLTTAAQPQYYLPYAQAVVTNPYLVIRSTGDPAVLQSAIRAVLHEMDKTVPLYQVATLENYVSQSAAQPRFQTLLLTCFAAIALLLAAIGLYGLLSYMVVQRTLEIGLRVALGAKKSDVMRMVVQRGLSLALIGLASGLLISAVITRLLSGMLYGIQPSDPIAFVATTGILLLASLAACSIPAYRAAQLDPIETLREQ
jgi:predicted permease